MHNLDVNKMQKCDDCVVLALNNQMRSLEPIKIGRIFSLHALLVPMVEVLAAEDEAIGPI